MEAQDLKTIAVSLEKFTQMINSLSAQECTAKLQTSAKGDAYWDVSAKGKTPEEVTEKVDMMVKKILEICKDNKIPVAGSVT